MYKKSIHCDANIHANQDASQCESVIKGTCNVVALGLHDASVAGLILKGSNLSPALTLCRHYHKPYAIRQEQWKPGGFETIVRRPKPSP